MTAKVSGTPEVAVTLKNNIPRTSVVTKTTITYVQPSGRTTMFFEEKVNKAKVRERAILLLSVNLYQLPVKFSNPFQFFMSVFL